MLLQEITYLAAAEVWDEFPRKHLGIPDSVSALEIFKGILHGPEFTEFKDRRDDATANPHEELIALVNHRLNDATMVVKHRILPHDCLMRISGLGTDDNVQPAGVVGSAVFQLHNHSMQRCHLRFRVTDNNVSIVLRTFARSPALGKDLFILALGKPNTGPTGQQNLRLLNTLTYVPADLPQYRHLILPVLKIAQRYAVPLGDKSFLAYLAGMFEFQEYAEHHHAA